MKNNEWKSVAEQPAIERGERLECWVAVSFEERNGGRSWEEKYNFPQETVIKLSWLNAELTEAELEVFEEEGELPAEAPSALDWWTNEDGEHANFTGWIDYIGGDEGLYRYCIQEQDGYFPRGDFAGRFKILAWQPVVTPDFPSEFSLTK
ncbi:hypothetical protein ENT52713_15380 [Enterobacter sp. 200527-13]|uniref:hypothetical protein n=1 Tax=Enterobacter TaxID=547 RepID=UPI0022C099FD|nr:hypothetical protein [Enterobacter sp. 200527-13]GLH24142.1 hypothetical protein ENT52713_15380 [Enterobacter sp. 200527-13]